MKNCIFLQLLYTVLLLSASRVKAQIVETADRQQSTTETDTAKVTQERQIFSRAHFDTSSFSSAPLTKTKIKATRKNNLVFLEWVAAPGSDLVKFEVEKSGDGIVFNKIGERDIKKAKADSSFSFIDDRPQLINYYRLKIINEQGSFVYSKESVINQNGSLHVAVQPNPFVQSFIVEVFLDDAQPVKIQMLDMNGRLLRYKSVTGRPGSNQIEFDDVGNIQPGIYMVRIVRGYSVVEKKIVKRN